MKGKIYSIQMLRAIAVALVIFDHVVLFIGIPHVAPNSIFLSIYHFDTWGAIGLDLFFCISGFIMMIVAPVYVDNLKWKEFLLKRIVRIIPLYYLISCLIIFLSIRQHAYPTGEILLKTLFFLPVFDTNKFVVPVVAVGWSLSYEIYFYLLLTLFIALKQKKYRRLIIGMLLLSIAGVLWNPDIVQFKFITSPILIEFIFGMTAGLIYKNIDSIKVLNYKSVAIGLTILGLCLMIISAFTGFKDVYTQEAVENDNYKALFRVIIWGIPTAIFLLGVVLTEHMVKFTTPNILILLGDASYSAYLLHLTFYQQYVHIYRYINWGGTFFTLSAVAFSLICSVIFYKLIEKPMTVALSKLLYVKKPVIMQ